MVHFKKNYVVQRIISHWIKTKCLYLFWCKVSNTKFHLNLLRGFQNW